MPTKTTKYSKASLLLKEKALESRMQSRAKRDMFHKKTVNAAIIMGAPLLLTWGVAQVSSNVREAVNENTKLEIALMIYTLVTAAVAMLAMVSDPFVSKKEAKARFWGEISELLKNKTLDADFNRELIRLAPMMQNISKQIAEKNPSIAKRLMQNDLTDKDADKVAEFMRKYLLSHPDDARKFVNVLTVAELPQDMIDAYIAQYVPDTLSFNMAQKLLKTRAK